jgi:hypothetical protein
VHAAGLVQELVIGLVVDVIGFAETIENLLSFPEGPTAAVPKDRRLLPKRTSSRTVGLREGGIAETHVEPQGVALKEVNLLLEFLQALAPVGVLLLKQATT